MTQRKLVTGRRKEATARVRLTPGNGEFIVNGKKITDYFSREVLTWITVQPFVCTERSGKYDVFSTVKGGGKAGQAGAIRHGLATALSREEPELRGILKKEGLLTRDARTVERKKPGKPKARKSFQFSKR